MIDNEGVQTMLRFARGRTLATIQRLEKSEDVNSALKWRPGPGRAHVGWQLMHLAATDDKILNARMKGAEPRDPELVNRFGGGSTPDDAFVPTIEQIKSKLHDARAELLAYLATADLQRVFEVPGRGEMSVMDWCQILTWHEAHHQGQVHLTLNLYDASI